TISRGSRKPSILRPAGAALFLLVALGGAASCVHEEPAPADPGGMAAKCHALDKLSSSEVDKVFADVIAELEHEGTAIDGSLWADPQKFARFVDATTKVSGCDITAVAKAATKPQGNGGLDTNWCGPGAGPHNPTVSECVNAACRDHDHCYDDCKPE